MPKLPENKWALDFRSRREHVTLIQFGFDSRRGREKAMRSHHLGNLYFTDHTIEYSFLWDGQVTRQDRYLYGADTGRGAGKDRTFAYGGYIGAGSRHLVHRQRGHYGGAFGKVEIDLDGAAAAGAYRFGQ